MHVRAFMFSPWLHEKRRLKVMSCCCHGNKDTGEEEERGGWVGGGVRGVGRAEDDQSSPGKYEKQRKVKGHSVTEIWMKQKMKENI